MVRDRERRQELIDHINAEQVDYVLILGDCDLWDPAVVRQFRDGLEPEVFFAPGNHETMDDERELEEQFDSYLANVGYEHRVAVLRDCNFIVVNTGADVVALNAFLEQAFAEIDPDNPTILFGHHRVWDDIRFSKFPNEQFKSYRFRELHPGLRTHVDAIFAANSSRIYFGFRGREVNNENVVLWCDVVDGIRCISCGMKAPNQVSYAVAEILDGEVVVFGRAHPVEPEDPWPPPLPPQDRSSLRYRIELMMSTTTFWAALGVGVVLGVAACAALSLLARRGANRTAA